MIWTPSPRAAPPLVSEAGLMTDTPVRSPTPIEIARAEYAAMRNAGADELTHAMALGDALIKIRETAPKRGWQAYVVKFVGVPKSTALLCIQLASARSKIESSNALDKSIRWARKLIQKPRAKPAKPESGGAATADTDEATDNAFADFERLATASLKLALEGLEKAKGNDGEIVAAVQAIHRLLKGRRHHLTFGDLKIKVTADPAFRRAA
jgi:hypothetical protein